MTRMEYLVNEWSDAQSQLDALYGECPEICDELERKIEAFERMIEAER